MQLYVKLSALLRRKLVVTHFYRNQSKEGWKVGSTFRRGSDFAACEKCPNNRSLFKIFWYGHAGDPRFRNTGIFRKGYAAAVYPITLFNYRAGEIPLRCVFESLLSMGSSTLTWVHLSISTGATRVHARTDGYIPTAGLRGTWVQPL